MTEIDLTELSRLNYLRHRWWRLASGLIGVAIVVGLAWEVLNLASSPGGRSLGPSLYFPIGVTCVIAFLFFAATWGPLRFLAPPPVGITVSGEGMEIELANGKRRTIQWNSPFRQVTLYLRPRAPGLPEEARFRMLILCTRNDQDFPWRRVIPVTYLPEAVANRVVESATAAGMIVERNETCRPVSLHPSIVCTGIAITRPPPKPNW